MVSAVLVCGGSSTRMQGVNKMALLLDGMPVWEKTLSVFQQCADIDEIVVVASKTLLPEVEAKKSSYSKLTAVVSGGATRQASALNGLAACDPNTDWIAVHDGARPMVTASLISGVLQDAAKTGAAAPAVAVKDTIKVRGDDGCVASTPDRSALFACQTPQIFAAQLYRKAAENAVAAGADYTDDCQMIEAMGGRIYLSQGDYNNKKITTPEDYTWAQMQLKGAKKND